jgi:hypothetical protein
MGRIVGKFVSGIVGPVIFKKVGNRQLVVAKSKKPQIAMTEATYRASYIFGRASTLGRYIRSGAYHILRFYDSGMISRLTGECNRIVQKITPNEEDELTLNHDYFSRLNGFEFNEASPVKRYLFAQPQATFSEESVVVNFPEMIISRDLAFAPHATYCTVALRVSLFDLKSNQYLNQEIQAFDVELNRDVTSFPSQELTFEGAPGALCIIYLSLMYAEKTFAGKAVLNSQEISPAAIFRAEFCPGESTEREHWRKIAFNEKKTRKKLKKKKASNLI